MSDRPGLVSIRAPELAPLLKPDGFALSHCFLFSWISIHPEGKWMSSSDVTQALLESAIKIQGAMLDNATDPAACQRIRKRIQGLKKLLEELFDEPGIVELSRDELSQILDGLEEIIAKGRQGGQV